MFFQTLTNKKNYFNEPLYFVFGAIVCMRNVWLKCVPRKSTSQVCVTDRYGNTSTTTKNKQFVQCFTDAKNKTHCSDINLLAWPYKIG